MPSGISKTGIGPLYSYTKYFFEEKNGASCNSTPLEISSESAMENCNLSSVFNSLLRFALAFPPSTRQGCLLASAKQKPASSKIAVGRAFRSLPPFRPNAGGVPRFCNRLGISFLRSAPLPRWGFPPPGQKNPAHVNSRPVALQAPSPIAPNILENSSLPLKR